MHTCEEAFLKRGNFFSSANGFDTPNKLLQHPARFAWQKWVIKYCYQWSCDRNEKTPSCSAKTVKVKDRKNAKADSTDWSLMELFRAFFTDTLLSITFINFQQICYFRFFKPKHQTYICFPDRRFPYVKSYTYLGWCHTYQGPSMHSYFQNLVWHLKVQGWRKERKAVKVLETGQDFLIVCMLPTYMPGQSTCC